jgi:hypothetical protein
MGACFASPKFLLTAWQQLPRMVSHKHLGNNRRPSGSDFIRSAHSRAKRFVPFQVVDFAPNLAGDRSQRTSFWATTSNPMPISPTMRQRRVQSVCIIAEKTATGDALIASIPGSLTLAVLGLGRIKRNAKTKSSTGRRALFLCTAETLPNSMLTVYNSKAYLKDFEVFISQL